MKWVSDLSLKGKRVLLRTDFNCPLKENGDIADDFRIAAALPALQYILSSGARLVVMSHLGDPEGKFQEKLSMKKAGEKLAEYLGIPVVQAPDCVGKEVEALAENLKEGEVFLLENVRFHKEEIENNEEFAKALSRLGNIYVSDAFGVLHREHASVVGVPKFLPSAGGLLLKKEIEGLQKLLESPERPMVAVVGGKKIESKLPVIDSIAKLADEVLLGNLLSKEIAAKKVQLKEKGKVVFPLDGNPPGKEYDIGPETEKLFSGKLKKAKTVFWSGPLGRHEEEQYARGSRVIAGAIKGQSYAVAGGGNLLDFLGRYNLRDKFDHISTGGSSMLAFLAGKELPGLKALGFYD